MKLLKSRALLLSLVSILFATTTADTFAQLTKIWEVPNGSSMPIEAISPNAKLVHASPHLIDLTNGNIIETKVSPESFRLTYSGDRYFVSNWQKKTMKVYDRYTKEFIQDVDYHLTPVGTITAPDDSTIFVYEHNTHTLQFWNIYTNELKESFKIPNTPDVSTYSLGGKPTYSSDGRYFAFHFQKNEDAEFNNFLLYDRQSREIIFQKTLPVGATKNLVYQFMHTTNQLAYGEVIKLEGDDKAFSYIRIFDLDQRQVIRDIKVSDSDNYVNYLLWKQDDKFIMYLTSNSNDTKFYDYANNKKNDFSVTTAVGPIYLDDSLYVSGTMKGYTFDWTVVGVPENPETSNTSTIYPNPTTNSISIDIDEKYFNGNWEISNSSGKILLKGTILKDPVFQTNIGILPPQTYYLRLHKDNFNVTYNFIKL